jgi:ABC-type antimicrobial peptide transport system permease subunit
LWCAPRSSILGLVGGRLTAIAAASIAVGLALLAATAPFLRASLFDVPAWDRDVLGAAAILLLGAAALAGLAPIRRALRVDPVISLREE